MSTNLDVTAPAKLLAPIGDVFPYHEVHLRHGLDVDQVEQGLPSDCAADDIHVAGELRPERSGDSFRITWLQLDDEIDVAGHAWLGVVAGSDGAGEHVGDAGSVEPAGHKLQDGKLVGHRPQKAAKRPRP